MSVIEREWRNIDRETSSFGIWLRSFDKVIKGAMIILKKEIASNSLLSGRSRRILPEKLSMIIIERIKRKIVLMIYPKIDETGVRIFMFVIFVP